MDVNDALPTKTVTTASKTDIQGDGVADKGEKTGEKETVKNDDFLVEAPSLFFAVMW